jgi:hypothetical protein
MFGRNSLEQARQYVQAHPEKTLVILKNARGRIAVWSPRLAQSLKEKGFQPVD